MKIKQTLLAVAIVITPMSAFAAGSLDVFYMHQKAEFASGDKDDGNGVGVRGQATLGQGVSLTALLQDAELKDNDINIRETRIGLSYDTKCHDIDVGGGIESVGMDLNDGFVGGALRGYSVNAHASISPIDNVTLSARVGYTDVDELAGMEYEIGASYAINKNVSGFVEYRMVNADDEGFGDDLDLDTLRVGARYNF